MRLKFRLKRLERRSFVWWMKFARSHQDSLLLPLVLFVVLFSDGFLFFIPSILCLMAAIIVNPHRWWLYALIFAFASTGNNAATYAIGRLFPPDVITDFVARLNLSSFVDDARESVHNYGSYAAFIGALIGLPNQFITGLIGMNDAMGIQASGETASHFRAVISFAFIGHALKGITIAILTRFGRLKLQGAKISI